ncbi:pyridoxine 5'-phosphate synthase [Acidisoma cellulosilytica]|uniref:Pyridoxine 5'-phosphate synthase n=1 Tax=Acidisoma cellulosilyticum TaxID=2802395 RepID=A0A963Z137_9PROT|nr:pyridoxine 5'-phosphate synthase [Acidisoma cellulosilyticum]MCB8880716.1 pyridoxine 5'-phosphate synthase [Acidisoma cellulosilyticum]
MAKLSVNLNKIALLRNSRHTGVPDVAHFARLAHEAGAHGLTVHPRPDERHIRRTDVFMLDRLMRPWRPEFEFNIEGYPDPRFMDLIAEVRPEQCTLVPDAPGAFTSDEGWKLGPDQMGLARTAIQQLKAQGSRAILFVDPNPDIVSRVIDAGAEGIELYTGGYAQAVREGRQAELLAACGETCAKARAAGLAVNVGHDLNLDNLPPLVAAMPGLAEASIGHELTADALVLGWAEAIRRYAAALAG